MHPLRSQDRLWAGLRCRGDSGVKGVGFEVVSRAIDLQDGFVMIAKLDWAANGTLGGIGYGG